MTAQQPVQEGYYKTEQGRWEIIANHEISGVTPEMIDWWWDHIDSTERYELWHPTDHHSFEWLIPPTTGHVGAVQRIEESISDVSAPPIEIRWEDANGAAAEYDHVLLASSTMGGVPATDLMHEYEEAFFGTRLRSHFHFPPGAPEGLIKALYQHNREEMRNFSTFLLALYRSGMGGCIASPKIFPGGFSTHSVFPLPRFSMSAETPPGAKNAKQLVPAREKPKMARLGK